MGDAMNTDFAAKISAKFNLGLNLDFAAKFNFGHDLDFAAKFNFGQELHPPKTTKAIIPSLVQVWNMMSLMMMSL
jgi:hypothetical protein